MKVFVLELDKDRRDLMLKALEAYEMVITHKMAKMKKGSQAHRNLDNKINDIQELSIDIVESDEAVPMDIQMEMN